MGDDIRCATYQSTVATFIGAGRTMPEGDDKPIGDFAARLGDHRQHDRHGCHKNGLREPYLFHIVRCKGRFHKVLRCRSRPLARRKPRRRLRGWGQRSGQHRVRGAVTQCTMQPLPIIKDFNVLEDRAGPALEMNNYSAFHFESPTGKRAERLRFPRSPHFGLFNNVR